MRGIIIIPAYNEGKVIGTVLSKLPQRLGDHKLDTVVINDGSSDNTVMIVRNFNIKVISHLINRGLGAALATGFEYARHKKYDFLITLDGDGQHDPREIYKLLKPIDYGFYDFIVGSRFFKKGMPLTRRIITTFASVTTFVLTGIWTSDSQSGFRAFSRRAIKNIFIEVDKMEVSSDFFRQAKEKKLKIKEIFIKPIYTKYSISKGQNYLNSFNIVVKLLLRKII